MLFWATQALPKALSVEKVGCYTIQWRGAEFKYNFLLSQLHKPSLIPPSLLLVAARSSSSNVARISHPPQGPASPCCEYLERGNPNSFSSEHFCGQALTAGVFGGSECRGSLSQDAAWEMFMVFISHCCQHRAAKGPAGVPGLCHLPHATAALSLTGLCCLFPTELLHCENSAGSREVLK